MSDLIRPQRALLSFYDKSRLVEIARLLRQYDIALLASGGTAAGLAQADIEAEKVEALTGFPELLGGRVKTLHPKIHGGILARRDHPQDKKQMAEHHIAPIDIVILGFYPFAAGLAENVKEEEQVALIDIGAPAMLRGAAKNYAHVVAVPCAEDMDLLARELEAHNGATRRAFRRQMAGRAFAAAAHYDSCIAHWFALGQETPPDHMVLGGVKAQTLRYGENPHQKAALYLTHDSRGSRGAGLAAATPLQGKALSFNNLTDAQAACDLVREFAIPACAIIKHANPCGVACGDHALAAWQKAFACDEQSAFGGVIAFNRPLDEATAAAIKPVFTELILAPAITPGARALLAARKNLRLLEVDLARLSGWQLRLLDGGFLVQSPDTAPLPEPGWQCVSRAEPDGPMREELLFAWRACRHVKSNAILIARDAAGVGIGAGQVSRVDAARIAAAKAGARARGAAAASDAFFPFADGLEILAEAGVKAVVQPGGSIRDKEVIAAADKAGMAMIFTGQRHFRH